MHINWRVIELDRNQPEVKFTWEQYRTRIVNDSRIQRGREQLAKHRDLLRRVQDRYGVPPEIIVGLWGLESDYGRQMGGFNVIEAVATLAWEGRRGAYFREQLMDCLKILQAGDIARRPDGGKLGRRDGPDPVHAGQLPPLRGRFRRRRAARHVDQLPRRVRLDRQQPGDGRLEGGAALGHGGAPARRVRRRRWPGATRAGRRPNGPGWASSRSTDGRLPPGDAPASVVLPGGAQGEAFLVYASQFPGAARLQPVRLLRAVHRPAGGPDRRLSRAARLLLAASPLRGLRARRAAPAPVPTPAALRGGRALSDRRRLALSARAVRLHRHRPGHAWPTATRGLTADGEAFDPDALAAAHRTLQLPALARVTNLETGRAVLVRLNDRGPAQPGPADRGDAAAPPTLLGASGSAPFRVRVELLEAESRQLAAAPGRGGAAAGGGRPARQRAGRNPGAARRARRSPAGCAWPPPGPPVPAAARRRAPADAVPLRLPEQVWQTAPAPGALYVECGSFARPQYAAIMQRAAGRRWARASRPTSSAPRDAACRVRIGPLRDIAEADATLDRALRAGVSDARIIVDDP